MVWLCIGVCLAMLVLVHVLALDRRFILPVLVLV